MIQSIHLDWCDPVRPSRDLPGCGCSVLVTPGNHSYLQDGGGGQPRTGDSRVSNPAFYPLNYPAIHLLPLSCFKYIHLLLKIIYTIVDNKSTVCYIYISNGYIKDVKIMKKREKSENIQHFIVDNLTINHINAFHPAAFRASHIARLTADHFKISRAAVARHIALLVKRNVLSASGNTKARTYALVTSVEERFSLSTMGLQEDVVWRERISPLFSNDIPENIRTICNYGFTEMLNNAIDHSESDTVHISFTVDAAQIFIWIRDFGIGVFRKLMRDLHLNDARHALLELSKGKLTTAAGQHTGQGIFFTSRIFDEYMFWANGFSFCRFGKDDDWLFETQGATDFPGEGTRVMMRISLRATQTAGEIMSQYSSELHDYGFTKTHVPLMLAKYEGEQLVSRSQAKRLMLRVDQFKEVILDFTGITTIGQAFADQIFRVFQGEHPELLIVPINENDEVKNMIARAKGETVVALTPSLFDAVQDDATT